MRPAFPKLRFDVISVLIRRKDAILAVATSNGMLDFDGAEYRLFYSRRPRQQPPSPASKEAAGEKYIVASLAAIKENKIVAKIEPSNGGTSQKEAFLALRRAVEVRLEEVLQVRV